MVYDYAGQVPVDGETAYVTRCSANPSHSNLDSCKEGQFVWFHKKTVLELSSGPVLVSLVLLKFLCAFSLWIYMQYISRIFFVRFVVF